MAQLLLVESMTLRFLYDHSAYDPLRSLRSSVTLRYDPLRSSVNPLSSFIGKSHSFTVIDDLAVLLQSFRRYDPLRHN